MRKLLAVAAIVVAAVAVTATTALAAEAGGGTVKVTLTSPRAIEGTTRSANIVCGANDGTYIASFGRTTANGRVVTGTLTVHGYAAPGNYVGQLAIAVRGPSGSAHATAPAVPVTITDGGGNAAFSRTLSGAHAPRLTGKVIAGTVTWTCGS